MLGHWDRQIDSSHLCMSLLDELCQVFMLTVILADHVIFKRLKIAYAQARLEKIHKCD